MKCDNMAKKKLLETQGAPAIDDTIGTGWILWIIIQIINTPT